MTTGMVPVTDYGPNACCCYWFSLESDHEVHNVAGYGYIWLYGCMGIWQSGWAMSNAKFTYHFYTWLVLGIEPLTFRSWVRLSIH